MLKKEKQNYLQARLRVGEGGTHNSTTCIIASQLLMSPKLLITLQRPEGKKDKTQPLLLDPV